ncbi:uncharacterized protein LOC134201741 [Bombyx mori]|uniref:uncharacterized protein LOC134201741 n=1 Tax=Bombyx mori TaxID=7091 RepID=UPI002ED5FA31
MSQESISYLEASARFSQESRLLPGSRFRVPGFACLRDDKNNGKCGSCILVSRSIPYSQITLPPHDSNCFNVVAVRALDISFLSVYIPDPNMSILTNLFSIIGALPPPVAVLGDFNIHHSSWGCYQNDSLSSAFLDLVDDHNLCILNDGSPTRRVLPGQNPKSAVDLSLCTPATSSRLTWLTLCNTHGSDHFPILMSFPDSSNYILPPRNPRLKFNLSKADWTLFSQSVDALLVNLSPVPHENTHAAYSIFRNALLSAAETAIPTKNASRGKIPSLPWWDSDCSDLCKQRKEAEMEYALHMSPANYISYKEVAARTVRTLSERKRLGWNMFYAAGSSTEFVNIYPRNRLPECGNEESLSDVVATINAEVQLAIQQALPGFLTEVTTSVTRAIEKKFAEFENSEKTLGNLYDIVKSSAAKNSVTIKKMQSENTNLTIQLKSLQSKLNAMEEASLKQEQWSRLQNVEVVGVPESAGESLPTIINGIAKQLNIKICQQELDFVHRIQAKRSVKGAPRNLIIRFHSRSKKDEVLSAARKCHGLTSKDIGMQDFEKAFDRVDHIILLQKLQQLGIHVDLYRKI